MLRRITELSIRRPRTVIAAWLMVILIGIGLGGAVFGRLAGFGGNVPGSESQTTAGRVAELDPGSDAITGLVTSSAAGRPIATNPAVKARVTAAVADLRRIPNVAEVADPYQTPGMTGDGTVIAVAVTFGDGISSADEHVALKAAEARLRAVGADGVEVRIGGGPLFDDALNAAAQHDAQKAEIISLPLVLVLLVLVFGGLLAASLPVLLALCGVASTLLILYGFSFATSLSVYSVQITTMLGLGLGVDYALLMVTRFREERAAMPDRARVEDCVRRTAAGAGRTVFFSGLTVAVSLAGIVVYPAPFLRSMGLASCVVVALDMLAAITLLPALLSRWGHRIRPAGPRRAQGRTFGRVAAAVVRRPVPVLLLVTAILAIAAIPAFALSMTSGDARELPTSSEVRQVYDLALAHFPGRSNADPITVLIEDGRSRPQYLAGLRALPGVVASSQKTYPDGSAIVRLTPSGVDDGPVAIGLVRTIRGEHARAFVTGQSARLVDFRQMLASRLPYSIAVVLLCAGTLLFLFTGSVLIPLKAVLTNLLSIAAALGAVVYVFQQGHFAAAFGSGGLTALDVTVPPLMIAVAFGLSMDYEIFILGRIREAREAGEDARASVVTGLRHTGRVVTCAAALLVIVFACFMTGGTAPILEFGLGLALAVLVDATLVRMLLVPATLALLGERAWWAPRPLRSVHRRIGLSDDRVP